MGVVKYSKLEKLGQGRSGAVYKAQDSTLGRIVAYRQFCEHKLDMVTLEESWKDSYMDHVVRMVRLSHPNLLRIIDGGVDEVGPFLASTLLKGSQLLELAEDGGLEIVDAYELAQQVLEALIAAREEGFHHYTLRPTSVIAQSRPTKGYTYILTDLGMGSVLPLIYGDREAEKLMQHPVLMAPEVYEGNPLKGLSSQYILGQLLYWLLVEEHPLEKLSIEDAYEWHRSGELTCVSVYRPEIPKEFTSWISRLLAPQPEMRFNTLEDALTALPAAPRRFYAKKVNLPPKPFGRDDVVKFPDVNVKTS